MRVSGLRGCPEPFELELAEKSMCVLGENGHGKTTLADALELFGDGDLTAYHREGCGLAAAIHLDAQQADVEVLAASGAELRTLTRQGAEERILQHGEKLPRGGPIVLRHCTIAEFMGMTPGDKKKALLELVGLEGLGQMRAPLKTAVGHAGRDAEAAGRALQGERAALDSQLAGEGLVPYAARRCALAGLRQTVDAPADVLGLELTAAPQLAPSAGPVVDRLAAALANLPADPTGAYNAQVADEAVVRADALAALLVAAQRVVASQDTACPVCDAPVQGGQLQAQLAQRAQALGSMRARLAEAQHALTVYTDALDELGRALQALLAAPGSGDWPQEPLLRAATEDCTTFLARGRAALLERTGSPTAPALGALAEALPELRCIAVEGAADARTVALVELAELRTKCERMSEAQRQRKAAEGVQRAADRLLEIADEEIETAIEGAIRELGDLAASYYSRLVRSGPYSDLQLVYRPSRSGQVEFTLTFDGRYRGLSPPQRVMSSSQLSALGLALMLARLRRSRPPWRVLVLDDVVNSFDGNHRQGVARLLADEFDDWQLLVLTHDRAFRDVLQRTVPTWRFCEIVAHSPATGPLLADADSAVLMRERLDEGRTAIEVTALARRALERALKEPLRRLRYETLHYDPEARYTAQDYLRALRRGLKHNKSPLHGLAVLQRMECDVYMTNLGVHDRQDSSALTADDMYRLLDDLADLEAALRCNDCGRAVWQQPKRNGGGTCGCQALAA
jgi:hypothetical protein